MPNHNIICVISKIIPQQPEEVIFYVYSAYVYVQSHIYLEVSSKFMLLIE